MLVVGRWSLILVLGCKLEVKAQKAPKNSSIFMILKPCSTTLLVVFAEMDKLWQFASNADSFELKDIVAALDEIQVD